MCVVCGKECGSLAGRAKSWRCAGVLSRSTVHWDAERSKYDNPGKRKARDVPMRILERLRPDGRYLELSGGGRSAEIARRIRPDVEIVSADKNEKLWPALMRHAADHAYTPLRGSFAKAQGLFDLIYLDLTGNSSDKTSMKFTRIASGMLEPDGWLVVTITPDHERDSAVSLNRPVAVASLLIATTGLELRSAMTYANGDGKGVTLCVLRGGFQRLDIVGFDEAMRRRGKWFDRRIACGFLLRSSQDELRERRNARQRARKKSPEARSRAREWQRQRRVDNPEWYRAYEQRRRAKRRLQVREKYATDPEYRERIKAERRARYANDPEFREAHKADMRERSRRRLAAVSGTTAEAISNEEAA